MIPSDDSIQALREALRVSPDNVPLRRHLAESLAQLGRFAESEEEYRAALAHSANDVAALMGLAEVYYRQQKNSAALVVVEQIVGGKEPPAAAHVLHARLMLQAGDERQAARAYRDALEVDPDARDDQLSRQLGIEPGRTPYESAEEEFGGRIPQYAEDGPFDPMEYDIERPEIKFADVGGMEAVKEEIRMKIILPIEQPELFKAYGKTAGGGVLMYGPPGCGKTYLARATAGEVNAAFMSIGISDVLDMWIGQSEKNLHELFEQARSNTPCVLFFDEVDALGASRSDMRQASGRHLINQFLSELDGVQSSNEGVLILAATNAPWHLDAAFRRPGRFDRILFVPPPDGDARAAILQLMLEGKPVDAIDHAQLAKKTDGFSGADLKGVVESAIESKLRSSMKSGKLEPVRTGDLATAVKRRKPSTREWFATAKNYAMYSNQGGTYDEILKYLKLK